VALECLRTRCNVFVLCWRLTPAASPADCRGLRRRRLCLITPPAPPHTSSVAVCLPDAFDLTATTSLPLGNYVTYSTLPRLYSACRWRRYAALLCVNALLFVTKNMNLKFRVVEKFLVEKFFLEPENFFRDSSRSRRINISSANSFVYVCAHPKIL